MKTPSGYKAGLRTPSPVKVQQKQGWVDWLHGRNKPAVKPDIKKQLRVPESPYSPYSSGESPEHFLDFYKTKKPESASPYSSGESPEHFLKLKLHTPKKVKKPISSSKKSPVKKKSSSPKKSPVEEKYDSPEKFLTALPFQQASMSPGKVKKSPKFSGVGSLMKTPSGYKAGLRTASPVKVKKSPPQGWADWWYGRKPESKPKRTSHGRRLREADVHAIYFRDRSAARKGNYPIGY